MPVLCIYHTLDSNHDLPQHFRKFVAKNVFIESASKQVNELWQCCGGLGMRLCVGTFELVTQTLRILANILRVKECDTRMSRGM